MTMTSRSIGLSESSFVATVGKLYSYRNGYPAGKRARRVIIARRLVMRVSKTVAVVFAVALLIVTGCSQKPNGNSGTPVVETVRSGETQVELTAAQARAGADAQLTFPERHQTITIKIPPGVTDGARLRLTGMGWPGADGTPQDYFIRIRVK